MANRRKLAGIDMLGLALIALTGGGAALFRQIAIVPRATVGQCAALPAPLFCLPRQAVLWAQYEQWFGAAALLLGLAGFVLGNRLLGIAAIAIGIAATVNYNATWGLFGAALGLWAWIGAATGRRLTTPPEPSP